MEHQERVLLAARNVIARHHADMRLDESDDTGTQIYHLINSILELCDRDGRGYGAWENDELGEFDRNLARLVWLTGCQLREGESEAYFSTY